MKYSQYGFLRFLCFFFNLTVFGSASRILRNHQEENLKICSDTQNYWGGVLVKELSLSKPW